MADPWGQFKRAGTQGATQFSGLGRLAVDPRKLADVAIAAGEMVAAPVRAAADILTNYNPGAENEPLNEDIGRQGFVAGPGALSPGLLRAAGSGELGVAAGRLLKRVDAQKLMREMREAGKSDRQIAEALNERFAPILDEGEQVSKGMVIGNRQRTELGAMGGAGRHGGKIAPEDVAQMMRDLGYENVRVAPARTGDSTYVSGDPYGNQPRPGSPRPLVRIPADEHIGRPARGSEAGSRFDTGTSPEFRDSAPRQVPADERVTLNQGGEPYADPEALRAALEWRAGGLVRPDQAPRGVRQQPPLDTPAPEPSAGPDNLPGQGRLLASGAAPINAWDTETNREDAGRFSRALASPDDQLVSDTRELTGRVAVAADEGNPGRFSRQVASVWDQFQRYGPEFEETLRGIDALDPGYHPGERMSDNVVDLRKPRSLWVEMRDQMLGRGF